MNTSVFYQTNGITIQGYDPVAYFTLNDAVKGYEQFSLEWEGAVWRFVNEDHLRMFSKHPEKYAPQFGGYCAFGASEGYKASTRPYAFTIENEKLYLNFADYVKKRWLEQKQKRIPLAEQQWNEVKSSVPIKAKPIPIWWKYQLLKLVGKDLFA